MKLQLNISLNIFCSYHSLEKIYNINLITDQLNYWPNEYFVIDKISLIFSLAIITNNYKCKTRSIHFHSIVLIFNNSILSHYYFVLFLWPLRLNWSSWQTFAVSTMDVDSVPIYGKNRVWAPLDLESTLGSQALFGVPLPTTWWLQHTHGESVECSRSLFLFYCFGITKYCC